MADFPTFEKNASRPRQAITIDSPELTGNETPQERAVKLQWAEADRLELDKNHPLSINRDAAQVTSDPYAGG